MEEVRLGFVGALLGETDGGEGLEGFGVGGVGLEGEGEEGLAGGLCGGVEATFIAPISCKYDKV